MRHCSTLLFASVVTTTVVCSAARAQVTPGDVRDLINARAAGGESELAARGYVNTGGRKGDDRSWTFWWNQQRHVCLSVATAQGRYDSIVSAPAADCRRPDDRPGAPPRGDTQPGFGPSPRESEPPRSEPPSGAGYRVDGRAVDVGLVCFGDGHKPALATSYGWTWNPRTDRYDYGNRTELRTHDFDASLTVQIWDGGGRIHLPKSLIPPINSRGQDGWWELTDLDMRSDAIRAKYRLNGINKPIVVIDRMSGRISITGYADYGFEGSCDQADQRNRRF